MMQFYTLVVHVSDAMKQRIARGDVPFDEREVARCTRQFMHVLCGDVNAMREDVVKAIEEGKVDPEAWCEFSNGFTQVNTPLLHAAIGYTRVGRSDTSKDALIDWIVEQQSCFLPDEKGTPAVHLAYALAYGRDAADKGYWQKMRGKPEFDVERVYYYEHPAYKANGSAPFIPAYGCNATMLEHECIRAQRYERYIRHYPNTDDFREDAISDDLIALGAVVPPEHMNRIYDHELFRQGWELQYQQMLDAIAHQNGARLDELLGAHAVEHGFSLGHGSDMCRREFWGPFWKEGRAAVMALPEWAQERLTSDIMVLMQEAMPPCVVQQWTHRVSEPEAQRTR